MDQSKLVYEYSKATRGKFNQELLDFSHNDEKTINEIINIIRVCQRDRVYSIKLVGYYIMEDPIKIDIYLKTYTDIRTKKTTRKNKDNMYDYIQLKDTDVVLLIVRYYIEARGESKTIEVPIAIPKTVNKYYYRIDGNWYYSMYQIVDGSTYNNSGVNSKKSTITQKTVFQPIKVYREILDLKTHNHGKKPATVYKTNVFTKPLLGMVYIFAKKTLLHGLDYLGISRCISFSETAPVDDDTYAFETGNGFFVTTPKMLYDKEPFIQSAVYTIVKSIGKQTHFEDIFKNDYWLKVLGYTFNNKYSIEKGMELCYSLEGLYDITTRETINLPDNQKEDIYAILRWIFREYSQLKVKDNLNIRAKKIRKSAYIASIYAMKLATGLHRISKQGKNVKVEDIETMLNIAPMHIVKNVIKTKLVTYRNAVNDMDAFVALKYTFKGPSGIADKSAASVPDSLKLIDPSMIEVIDMDTSSNSDPGLSGMLAPYANINEKGYLDGTYEEPNTWEQDFNDLMNQYNDIKGIEQVLKFKQLSGDHTPIEEEQIIIDTLNTFKGMGDTLQEADATEEVILRQPFTITYGMDLLDGFIYLDEDSQGGN